MKKKPVIKFENFSFQYFSQAKPTLHNINLEIYEGEKVLIVGPSGSGKSTLGNCINGLVPYSYHGEVKGTVEIVGKNTKDMSIFELSKKVGTVLQDSDGQFVGLSVGEDIAFALENDCVDEKKMKSVVQKVADIVDMGKLLKSSPYELSGGQKQRVAFAGVMVDDVDVLLFDEPLANLDPATGKTAIELIDDIHKEYNKTVVIIEHRLEDVLHRHIDRVIVVSEGRIVADMNPHELVASNMMTELGIREPLYVTAMKHAGIKITEEMKAGHMQTLIVDDMMKEKMREWNAKVFPKYENNSPEILRGEHITFQYDSTRKILKDINFSIREGEMVSIVGTNGAGKSTLAKLICGFMNLDDGDIIFQGKSLKGQTIKERSQNIGYVMQNPNQMICKTMIFDEVALGLRVRGVSEDIIKEKVEKVLKICGLYAFRNWPVAALSFGQKKRVTIASILVMEPKVLILDEPTAGQDYRHYTEIMEFLKSLNKEGVTIILITHDMHLMLEYTPHAIVINNGEKIGDGTAVSVLTHEEIASKASLKVTSIYELAVNIGIEEPEQFVQQFIDYEREVCRRESKAV